MSWKMNSQHAVTHSDLLPDPRTDTPWQVLYHSQNDHGFITTMGFDVGGKVTVAWAACLRQVIIKAFWHRDPKVSGNENVSKKSVYIQIQKRGVRIPLLDSNLEMGQIDRQ